jgi:hypothetical protein
MEGTGISHPIDLPEKAIQLLRRNAFVLSCLKDGQSSRDAPASWFVASEIHLKNDAETDFVVMPRDDSKSPSDNACLFHAYSMPFWVLINTNTEYTLALEDHTQVLRILDTRSHGYRDIGTSLGTMRGQTTSTFSFDGSNYKLKRRRTIPPG